MQFWAERHRQASTASGEDEQPVLAETISITARDETARASIIQSSTSPGRENELNRSHPIQRDKKPRWRHCLRIPCQRRGPTTELQRTRHGNSWRFLSTPGLVWKTDCYWCLPFKSPSSEGTPLQGWSNFLERWLRGHPLKGSVTLSKLVGEGQTAGGGNSCATEKTQQVILTLERLGNRHKLLRILATCKRRVRREDGCGGVPRGTSCKKTHREGGGEWVKHSPESPRDESHPAVPHGT